ncbi:putative DD41D transposase [Trichonephila clavipes]|nr:putative DD41D transposase [Trichonephila clavipes]
MMANAQRNPQISYTHENIEKVSSVERLNRFSTIAESVGISLVTCQWILFKDLNMHIFSEKLNAFKLVDGSIRSTSTNLVGESILLPPSQYGGYDPRLVTEWVGVRILSNLPINCRNLRFHLLPPEKLQTCLWSLVLSVCTPFLKISGDRYRAMITNFFIPELNNHDVQELWFQQDGATCHTARATIDLLKDTFGDRLISRFGPVNWPPRSILQDHH